MANNRTQKGFYGNQNEENQIMTLRIFNTVLIMLTVILMFIIGLLSLEVMTGNLNNNTQDVILPTPILTEIDNLIIQSCLEKSQLDTQTCTDWALLKRLIDPTAYARCYDLFDYHLGSLEACVSIIGERSQ